MIGRRLQHYEIVEKLGEGGMGVVYKARDTHLDRFVAVKVLPPEKVADAGRKARFVQEAKAASALNHPNIVHVYDISSDSGTDFIAMEYVAGKTLDQIIPRKGMRLNDALKIAVQIADALTRAHAAGIVHRDLKPSNMMVDEHGLVKVLDFGLAKLTEHGTSEEDSTVTIGVKTGEGTIVGTTAYMSPEQAEGKPIDARSDIFSFGAVLYEMMTGHRAFHGDSKLSTLSAVLHNEPTPLSQETPQDLAKVIARCLRKDRERRYQHMVDVKLALQELKEDSESGATSPTPKTRRRRWGLWATAAATILVVAAAGWRLLPLRSKAPHAQLRATPLTAHAGFETYPTFAPDGNQIAFTWNGENQDNFDIYVKLVGPGSPLRLTSDPASDFSPAWSPDGRWIAFLRVPPMGPAAVLLMPALGGPERQIGKVGVWRDELLLQSHLAWTPDGKWLVVSDGGSGGEAAGLFLLSPESGERKRLAAEAGLSPALSPDGRRLAYVKGAGQSVQDLYLIDLSGDLMPQGAPRRLTLLAEAVASPAWTPDGREILFSTGGHLAQRALWRIAASPGSSPRREPVGEDCGALAVSRLGRRLVYSRNPMDSDIWRVGLRDRTVVEGPPAKIIFSTRIDDNPQYSPDGKRIAFNSHRSGTEEVWVSSADGSSPLQVTSGGGPMIANPRWSPDGQVLVVHTMLGGERGIDVVPASGGAPRRIAKGGAAPTWSRDGKWIYFGREGQVRKAPAGGGDAVQVTRDGGGGPAFESADGQFLFYLRRSHIWKMSLAGGPETQVVQEYLSYNMNYAVVEDGLYLVAASPSGFLLPGTLCFFEFATGAITPLVKIQRWYMGLAVAPDRRSILYCQWEAPNTGLMLVENFR